MEAPPTPRNKESVTIEMKNATKTTNTQSVAKKAENGQNNDCADYTSDDDEAMTINEDAATDDGDESDDTAIIHALLRKAAADPDQPSLDDWRLVCGFSGKAVEDAYQAGHASIRAQGVMVSLFLCTGGFLTQRRGVGNASKMHRMLELNFPIFGILLLFILTPLTIKLLQGWKPVKHRHLVYMTSCALAILTFVIMLVVFLWLVIDQGHDVSRPNLVMWTFIGLMIPIYIVIFIRPSAWLTSTACILGAALFGAVGNYSNTFDSYAVSIVAGVFLAGILHITWFVIESTSRISFVHQLSAMTRRSETFVQIVAATAHDMRTPVSAIQSGCQILQMNLNRGALSELPRTITKMNAALETSLCSLDNMLHSSRLLEGMDIVAKREVLNLRED